MTDVTPLALDHSRKELPISPAGPARSTGTLTTFLLPNLIVRTEECEHARSPSPRSSESLSPVSPSLPRKAIDSGFSILLAHTSLCHKPTCFKVKYRHLAAYVTVGATETNCDMHMDGMPGMMTARPNAGSWGT